MPSGRTAQDAAAHVLTILWVWSRRGVTVVFVMSSVEMEVRVDLMMIDAWQAMNDGRGEKDQGN